MNARHLTTVKRLLATCCLVLTCTIAMPTRADEPIDLNLREVDISEAMEMLARKSRQNILLGDDVSGTVSLNLFQVSVSQAIRAIADAAGYAVEKRGGAFFVLSHEDVGRYTNGNLTSVRRFIINYADPDTVGTLLTPYLSSYGKLTVLPEQRLVIVSDKSEFLGRIARLVQFVDAEPRQVMIEAQILEVTLTDEESYGINWAKLFESDGGTGEVGTRGLASGGGSANTGFLFSLVTPNVDVTLTALTEEGRVRTLSTPKLLALDNQEASVIIGDRRGYQVTTTINQVTSETIEFLESGVILRVTPHIDNKGRVLMNIHPEVSNGAVDANGIPSQTTTEVTTSLLVPDGQTVFIGGLMKHTANENYQRVPLLGRTPVVKRLFSNRERSTVNTETVVLITPHLIEQVAAASSLPKAQVDGEERALQRKADDIEARVSAEGWDVQPGPDSLPPVEELPVVASTASVAAAPATSPQQPDAVAVQLMTMTSQAELREFIEDHDLRGLKTVPVYSGGRHRLAVLYGVYADMAAAQAAVAAMPANLTQALGGSEPWYRSAGSLERDAQRARVLAAGNR